MEKSTIFISHITQEKEVAHALKELLEKRFLKTIKVFASSHDESLQLGDNWMETIKTSMKNCELVIIMCSPLSITRPWINFEAGAGWIKDIPVIPLCHSGLTPEKLPVPINSFQGGILNDRDDIKKVFKRIANLLNIDAPNSDDEVFHNLVYTFEKQIEDNSLQKNLNFINNLLYQQILLLKYCIQASTYSDEYLPLNDFDDFDIKDRYFSFNDIFHLFDVSSLIMYRNRNVYELFHETIYKLSDNIKFILTYTRIEIAPNIQVFFDKFLISVIKVDDWYHGILMLDKQINETIKLSIINTIKENTTLPARKFNNLINYPIAYYESLIFFRDWIIEYDNIIISSI